MDDRILGRHVQHWPRLADRTERAVAATGAALAFLLTPVLPAGLVIVVAGAAVLIGRPWRPELMVAPEAGR